MQNDAQAARSIQSHPMSSSVAYLQPEARQVPGYLQSEAQAAFTQEIARLGELSLQASRVSKPANHGVTVF